MIREYKKLKEKGVNITEEQYLELKEELEKKIANGFSTNDFIVNEIVSKYFSKYFSKDKLVDFLFENGELYLDALNECFGFLLPVAGRCSNTYCEKFAYSDYYGHLSGNAKLADNSNVSLDIITCDICDKHSRPVVKSIICLVFSDEEKDNLIDVKFAFLTDNEGTYVGDLSDIAES